MKKYFLTLLSVFGLLVVLGTFTSCDPLEIYTVRTDLVFDKDTLHAGDSLKVVSYRIFSKSVVLKNRHTGERFVVDSCQIDKVYNIVNKKNIVEDQASLQHGNVVEEYMPELDIPDETMKLLESVVVISTTFLLVLLIVGLVLVLNITPSKVIGISLYAVLMLASLTANMSYFLYYCGQPESGGFYDYLFSPGDYGWWMTLFYWIVFFVLSAVNLFAFRVTIFVSEAATERKFHGDFVFIALLVWFIVYLFSPNTLNPYFVYAIYGIMTLHFIFLLFSNFKVKAPLWEMLCIYVYFWVCLFPVITSTLSTIVLIPILLFAFVLVRSAPGMVAAGFSSEAPQEKEVGSPIIKGEKACVYCSFYEKSEERCRYYDSHKDRFGSSAYSCPYYS